MSTSEATETTAPQDGLRSRLPDPTSLVPEVPFTAELTALTVGLAKAVRNGSIPRTTIGLVQLRAGQIVGSTYHAVDKTGNLRRAGETEERITAVASWRDAPYFTEAERIALELVEAVLSTNPGGERVPDELYARVAAHYDDQALWTLTLVISQMCFFIPVALIARPIPGKRPGTNYSQQGARAGTEVPEAV